MTPRPTAGCTAASSSAAETYPASPSIMATAPHAEPPDLLEMFLTSGFISSYESVCGGSQAHSGLGEKGGVERSQP